MISDTASVVGLAQYGAVGLWALSASGACAYLVKALVKAKEAHIADREKWAQEVRADDKVFQAFLRDLGQSHADVGARAGMAHAASVGAIKRLDALANAIPGVNQLMYQQGKNGSIS